MSKHMIAQLEKTVAFLKNELEERRKDPADYPLLGCGDHSCLVAATTGMGTNGGCRCSDFKLRMGLQWWKRKAAFLEETIRTMKEGTE